MKYEPRHLLPVSCSKLCAILSAPCRNTLSPSNTAAAECAVRGCHSEYDELMLRPARRVLQCTSYTRQLRMKISGSRLPPGILLQTECDECQPAERTWWSSQVGSRARVLVRLEAVWGGAKNHQRQRHQPGLEGVAIIHIWAYSPPMNCNQRLISEPSQKLAILEKLMPSDKAGQLEGDSPRTTCVPCHMCTCGRYTAVTLKLRQKLNRGNGNFKSGTKERTPGM